MFTVLQFVNTQYLNPAEGTSTDITKLILQIEMVLGVEHPFHNQLTLHTHGY